MTYLYRTDRGHRAICETCPWKSRWLPELAEVEAKAELHMAAKQRSRK